MWRIEKIALKVPHKVYGVSPFYFAYSMFGCEVLDYVVIHNWATDERVKIDYKSDEQMYRLLSQHEGYGVYGYLRSASVRFLVVVDSASWKFLDYVEEVSTLKAHSGYPFAQRVALYNRTDKDDNFADNFVNVTFLDQDRTLVRTRQLGADYDDLYHAGCCTLFQYLCGYGVDAWYKDRFYLWDHESTEAYQVVFNDVEAAKRMLLKADISGYSAKYRHLQWCYQNFK